MAKRREGKKNGKHQNPRNHKKNKSNKKHNDSSTNFNISKVKKKQPFIKATGKGKLSTLQNEMQERLQGAKFRMLNQQLYTTVGTESFSTFQKSPDLFEVYHVGFRRQVEKWPTNPIDIISDSIEKQFPKSGAPVVIADFGCGDAQLAACASKNKTVHSFDLVSNNPRVVAADMANVPLENESVDVAVYSLSLMSTNVRECILEGRRVLKKQGLLKIAEVKSRLETPEIGGIDGFVQKLKALGFDLKKKVDASNRMFVLFDLVKSNRPASTIPNFSLKACEYKRR